VSTSFRELTGLISWRRVRMSVEENKATIRRVIDELAKGNVGIVEEAFSPILPTTRIGTLIRHCMDWRERG
jgi:hypothetical protein